MSRGANFAQSAKKFLIPPIIFRLPPRNNSRGGGKNILAQYEKILRWGNFRV